MKLILKKDWDIPTRFNIIKEEQEGHFVGREKELMQLINELSRKQTGSILISGHRGVGKTSFVYEALNKIVDNKTVVVLFNAAQLEAETREDNASSIKSKIINPRKIIENIIRRLYASSRVSKVLDKKIKEQINDLYRKAVAKEFKLSEVYQQQLQSSEELVNEENFELKLDENTFKNLIFVISWTVSILFLFTNLIPIEELSKIVALFLSYPVPSLITYSRKRKIIHKQIDLNINKAETLYQFDNSLGNLEFDLDQIHKAVKRKNIKLIYLIDELDKLEENEVKEVLKFFKNLFTISDAIFLFLGGEDLFLLGTETKGNKQSLYRPQEYTYFGSKYFLSRPTWDELNLYFGDIIEHEELPKGDEERNLDSLGILQKSICFDANNDFFDIKSYIKNRITNIDNEDHPIIEWAHNEEDVKKSRFYKAITVLFEEKYKSEKFTEWKENEKLLRGIFEYAKSIYNAPYKCEFPDPGDDSILSELKREYNRQLYRLGAFEYKSESSVAIKNIPTKLKIYTYSGRFPNEPQDHLNVLIEFEERFIIEFKKLANITLELTNVIHKIKGVKELSMEDILTNPQKSLKEIASWQYNPRPIITSNLPIFNDLSEKKPPYNYRRENLDNISNQLKEFTDRFYENLENYLSIGIRTIYQNNGVSSQKLQANSKLLSGNLSGMKRNFLSINPNIVFSSDLSRQVMILKFNDNVMNNIENNKELIEENYQNIKVILLSNKEAEAPFINGVNVFFYDSTSNLKASLIKLFRILDEFFSS